MRVFVACFVDAATADRLAKTLQPLPGMRRVPPENLHLTLHFVGNVAESQGADVVALTESLGGKPIRSRVRSVTGFPAASCARTVVALLDEPPEWQVWHDTLVASWPTKAAERGYVPHITLGRSREGVVVPETTGLEGLSVQLLAPAAYESRTLPEGARYRRLGGEAVG
jgi:2'-5' RNA ligase